jgi:hypothetical protein
MLPEFVGLEDHLVLPIRKALIDPTERGAVQMEGIELADGQRSHPRVRRVVDMRWRSQNSPARRAVCAALARFEDEAIELMTVRIADRALGHEWPVHVVGWTLDRLNLLPDWIRQGQGQWLHVVNPSRSKPLVALRFTGPVAEALPGEGSRLLN